MTVRNNRAMICSALLACLLLFTTGCKFSSFMPGMNENNKPETPDETLSQLDPIPDQSEENTTPDPDTEPTQSQPDQSEPSQSEPLQSEPSQSEPSDTEPGAAETQPSESTEAPEQPSEVLTLTLDGGICEWEMQSDSGSRMNLYAVCEASKNSDGSLLVSVNLFLSHLSIECSARTNCQIRIGDEEKTFATEAIRQETQDKTMTYLTSMEVRVDADTPFVIEAEFPFYGVYSGVEIHSLTLSETILIVNE